MTIDDTLKKIAGPEWQQYNFSDDTGLIGIVYLNDRDVATDVIVLYDQSHARVYRANVAFAVSDETASPFTPDTVSFFNEGDAERAIEALLRLPEPGHRHAPTQVLRFPGTACVPPEWLRSITDGRMRVVHKGEFS